MPVTVEERFRGRRRSGNGAELEFIIRGTDDDALARTSLLADAPGTHDGLVLDDITDLDQIGDDSWLASVGYKPIGSTLDVGESSFAFNTGGSTAHITNGRQHIASYPATGVTATDHKGAINVVDGKPEGVDVYVPQFEFEETHVFENIDVDNAYILAVFNLTAKTNTSSFRGFAARSVLFLGASGSKRGDGKWEITFRFAASPNVSSLTLGGISGIAKNGWEYLWVEYEPSDDSTAKALAGNPRAVHVEKVYDDGDFDDLGIGA